MSAQNQRLMKMNTKTARDRLLRDQKQHSHMRRHTRHDCFIIGALTVIDRSLRIEGVIKELSAGGFLFRPASTYLLHRMNDRVAVEIGDYAMMGKIMATKPIGYGVKFLDEMDEDIVLKMLEDHNLA